MRLLLAIVILFAVCWLPVHLLHFLIFFYQDIYLALPQSVPLFLFWVSHANSALNPCVVILLNGSFRKTLMALIRSLSCRLRFKSNRVNCVSYELFQPFDTRLRQRCPVDASAQWNKHPRSSPVILSISKQSHKRVRFAQEGKLSLVLVTHTTLEKQN